MSESTRVLVALGAAVAGGIAIAASGIAPLIRAADFIAPVGTLWVNAIRMERTKRRQCYRIVAMTVASLDDPKPFPPEAAIWTGDKLPWVKLDPSRGAFRRSRDENV